MVEISFLSEPDRTSWEKLARGVATAVIEWVARDAQEHGFPSLYWNTLEDAPARALYDKVGKYHAGFIHYSYLRGAKQASS